MHIMHFSSQVQREKCQSFYLSGGKKSVQNIRTRCCMGRCVCVFLLFFYSVISQGINMNSVIPEVVYKSSAHE